MKEAEWVLKRLFMTLKKELKRQSEPKSESKRASSAEMPEVQLPSSSGSSGLLDKDRRGTSDEPTESK